MILQEFSLLPNGSPCHPDFVHEVDAVALAITPWNGRTR